HAPAAVKDFAINEFGSNDKTVLVWGIRVVLILFAIAIGIVAVRKLWLGMVGLAIFAGIGLVAALTRPTAKATDALPTLIGAGVAAFAMLYLADLARGRPAARWRPRSRLANTGERPVPASASAAPAPDSAAAAAAAADEDLQPDRRRFLTIGAVAAGISVLTYAGGSWLGNTRDVNAVQQALK